MKAKWPGGDRVVFFLVSAVGPPRKIVLKPLPYGFGLTVRGRTEIVTSTVLHEMAEVAQDFDKRFRDDSSTNRTPTA